MQWMMIKYSRIGNIDDMADIGAKILTRLGSADDYGNKIKEKTDAVGAQVIRLEVDDGDDGYFTPEDTSVKSNNDESGAVYNGA